MSTVIITEPAHLDVDHILRWLEERSSRGAANWMNRYLGAIEAIRNSAASFGLAPESQFCVEDVRELIFKTRYGDPYRIVFTIQRDIIYVLRVRGTGQPLLAKDEIEFPDSE